MKICAIIVLLAAVAESSFLNCSYSIDNRDTYQCVLTINNPSGLNNFTEIGGVHLEEFTDSDVRKIFIARDTNSISTNIPSIICDTFTNLVWIDLSEIGLTQIGDDDFTSCSRVTQLDLDSNYISSITENAFMTLIKLDGINLNSNNLAVLHENLFINQTKLTTLRISSNPFQDIPLGFLQHLSKLDSLFVDHTNISEIKSQLFVNTNLQTLFMSNNNITVLPESLTGLEKLKSLLFTSNGLREIQSSGFIDLKNLEVLYLDDNKLTELRADTFLGLGKLIHLFLSHNPIESINENAFRGLDNLRSLDLDVCRIRRIESSYFQNLRSLTSLSLYKNEIEELEDGVFGALQLHSITLAFNQLKIVRRSSFGSLYILDWFDVASNNLSAFDRAIIDEAGHLEKFFFNNNLCASYSSRDVKGDRTWLLSVLQECFDNYENTLPTTTLATTSSASTSLDTVAVDTTTECNQEIKLPAYQVFQNLRFKYIILSCLILLLFALLVVFSIIYVLRSHQYNRNQGYFVNQ